MLLNRDSGPIPQADKAIISLSLYSRLRASTTDKNNVNGIIRVKLSIFLKKIREKRKSNAILPSTTDDNAFKN